MLCSKWPLFSPFRLLPHGPLTSVLTAVGLGLLRHKRRSMRFRHQTANSSRLSRRRRILASSPSFIKSGRQCPLQASMIHISPSAQGRVECTTNHIISTDLYHHHLLPRHEFLYELVPDLSGLLVAVCGIYVEREGRVYRYGSPDVLLYLDSHLVL